VKYKGLSSFTTQELLTEIERRIEVKRDRTPIKPCDECAYFVPWSNISECPKTYNPCSKGHSMSFRLPKDYQSTDWGFYRPGCKDRK